MTRKTFLFLALMTVAIGGCKRDYFEPTAYEELVESSFPVTQLDKNHTWATIGHAVVQLNMGLMPGEQYELTVYDHNPADSAARLSLLWQATVSGKERVSVSTDYLLGESGVWVGATDKLGYMCIYHVPVTGRSGTATLSFDNAQAIKLMDPRPQTAAFSLRYLFEKDFPQSGDFDFNDVVLTLTPVVSGRHATLTVSLDAVGALEQMGAAIRIAGLSQTDVVSCQRVGNLDEAFPFPMDQQLRIIKSNEALLPDNMKYGTSDVVVNLFSNAHWAMKRQLAKDGSFPSLFLNTKEDESRDKDYENDVPPATVTFEFELASEVAASKFRAECLDVFIVEEYNGGFWEVHTMPWKTDEVLRDYATGQKSVYGNVVPWALCVPGYVAYPFEQQPIATSIDIAVAAYQKFTPWARNHTQDTNWYDYPTRGLVRQ